MGNTSDRVPADNLDLLLIGPAARDLLPDGGWRIGGTVLYGALAAARFGLRVGVVTSAPSDVAEALRAALPDVLVVARDSATASTFENVYDATGARKQFLRARCDPLRAEDIPPHWRTSQHIWLAPLARDVDSSVLAVFASRARIAATPQGWLRQWDARGLVTPGVWAEPSTALARFEALILSEEDVRGPAHSASDSPARVDGPFEKRELERARLLHDVSGPMVIVTQGERGATLFTPATAEHFPAFPVATTDPTGAGDVFAGALLSAWWTGSGIRDAIRVANAAASFLVERGGVGGVPTHAEALARAHDVT